MEASFDALYELHASMVYWTVYGISNNHDTAVELMQTVFVKALECWNIVGSLQPLQTKSWLYKSARNAAIDRLRKDKREELTNVLADEPNSCAADQPESALILREQSQAVWNAVETLPPIYRAPIILHYFARLSQDEAASVLRISGGTCRSRLSRGRAMLGKVLCCEVH